MPSPFDSLHKIPLPNLEFLLVKVDLSGRDAGAALALPENKGRCLFENARQGCTSRAKVIYIGQQNWNSLILMWYRH